MRMKGCKNERARWIRAESCKAGNIIGEKIDQFEIIIYFSNQATSCRYPQLPQKVSL